MTDIRRQFSELSRKAKAAVLASATALLLAIGTTSWGLIASDDDTVDAYLDRSGLGADRVVLRVGIFKDEPLLSWAAPTKRASTSLKDHQGFQIELIRELAHYLGFKDDQVHLVETQVQRRSVDLNNDVVDVVVATYSFTPPRELEVNFAKPYLLTQPELLTRPGHFGSDPVSMRQIGDLGARLCTVGSSTSERALRAHEIKGFDGVASSEQCVNGLLENRYDAFMLDQAVLAGYKDRHGAKLELVELVLDQTEEYGIAVANDDEHLRMVIRNFLLDSYERGESGAWQKAWDKTLSKVLGDRRQPKPHDYQRLRDYQDRYQKDVALGPPGESALPPGRSTAGTAARTRRRARR
ncbi:transporter substrate-binding domain-containing protein [Micromonospora sp. BQ11]|uniref:transporter substrate-binding domain-containing protein n=1 Tax=Micromonospora sp. BQ11 TaxID=3452212 RepID=UPI003F89BB9C